MRRHLFPVVLLSFFVAAAPTRPPTVTVTKTDNTTVRGQVSTIDPKAVTIQPLVKNQPDGQPLTIPWSEIKSLSSGMTRERVIKMHIKDHPDDVCTDCRGEGKVPCATCKGTGRDPASAKDCATCHGEQTVPCKTPKCDHGKIPCPKLHLKLEEGSWYKKPDGTRWRKFPLPDGYFEVSEHHLGEIIETVNGMPQPPKPCPLCAGKMIIDDPKCRGTGLAPCPTCATAARTSPCKDCERGRVACKTCGGLGLKPEITDFTATPEPAATPPAPATPTTPKP